MAGNIAAAGRAMLVRRGAIALALLGAAGAGGAAAAPMFAEHAGHYAARAAANDRSILEEIMAQPLCSGANTPFAAVSP